MDKIKDGQSTEFKGLQASYETLADNGNMSSVTILFLLKNMISKYLQKKEEVLALGFGPGLTMESVLLETVSSEN